MTPAGMPEASRASANSIASRTVSGEGLSTIVQPAASAGACLNAASACG